MPLPVYRKREGLRKVYRASASNKAARIAYLDGLADTALASSNSGKILVSASAGGTSSAYSVFNGWASNDVLDFANWARNYVEEADVADSIALVSPPVRRFSADFSGVAS